METIFKLRFLGNYTNEAVTTGAMIASAKRHIKTSPTTISCAIFNNIHMHLFN